MQRRWTQGPDFSRILTAHPDQAATIRRLLLCDPAFRELCEDYLTVLDMIANFDPRAAPDGGDLPEEYVRLGVELERDIARALLRSTPRPGW